MKLLHLSDLHLGKRVNEFSMLEDQKYILEQVLQICDREHTDGVLLAGDIYDRKEPSIEAVQLFDEFLVRLAEKKQKVFLISGNHDSGERLAFAARLLKENEIFISSVYQGKVETLELEDEYGSICVHLLPFVKLAHVARFFPEEEIKDYTQAIGKIVEELDIDEKKRNVLVLHQYVAGATRCESEETSVGGLDDVSTSVLEPFDYVALGHLHGPQRVTRDTIRYCGTLLKYSFSEEHHHKSVTLVELKEKGNVEIKTLELHPLRDMCSIKGSYQELMAQSFYEGTNLRESYLQVTLTDEEDVPEALGKMRVIYPYIMKLGYDNTRTRRNQEVAVTERVEDKTPMELFCELFELQNNQGLSAEQMEYMEKKIEDVWGGAKA